MPTNRADMEKIWEAYFRQHTLEQKNALVVGYVDLVEKTVRRMMPTYEGYSNFDDMVSSGILGLMDAIEKYDGQRNVKFEHYAVMRIRGEVIDQIRKQDWAPSSLRRKIKAISNAYAELENTLYRSPTDAEVAAHVGMAPEDVLKVIEKSHMFNIIHFEEMVTEDAGAYYNVPSEEATVEQQVERQEMKSILGDLIDELPEKEKLVITLYYYEEMTLKEIAGIVGVTESRISQIHSKVIMKLRGKIRAMDQ